MLVIGGSQKPDAARHTLAERQQFDTPNRDAFDWLLWWRNRVTTRCFIEDCRPEIHVAHISDYGLEPHRVRWWINDTVLPAQQPGLLADVAKLPEFFGLFDVVVFEAAGDGRMRGGPDRLTARIRENFNQLGEPIPEEAVAKYDRAYAMGGFVAAGIAFFHGTCVALAEAGHVIALRDTSTHFAEIGALLQPFTAARVIQGCPCLPDRLPCLSIHRRHQPERWLWSIHHQWADFTLDEALDPAALPGVLNAIDHDTVLVRGNDDELCRATARGVARRWRYGDLEDCLQHLELPVDIFVPDGVDCDDTVKLLGRAQIVAPGIQRFSDHGAIVRALAGGRSLPSDLTANDRAALTVDSAVLCVEDMQRLQRSLVRTLDNIANRNEALRAVGLGNNDAWRGVRLRVVGIAHDRGDTVPWQCLEISKITNLRRTLARMVRLESALLPAQPHNWVRWSTEGVQRTAASAVLASLANEGMTRTDMRESFVEPAERQFNTLRKQQVIETHVAPAVIQTCEDFHLPTLLGNLRSKQKSASAETLTRKFLKIARNQGLPIPDDACLFPREAVVAHLNKVGDEQKAMTVVEALKRSVQDFRLLKRRAKVSESEWNELMTFLGPGITGDRSHEQIWKRLKEDIAKHKKSEARSC